MSILSHLDDEIRKARYREFLDVRLGRIRNVDPEHGPIGRNQDAMAFHIDTNDGAVETLFLGEAGVSHQAEEDETEENETEEDSEKSRTPV
ncbi:MAG: hypothetical protein ACREIL_00120 [Nitrospiraceae bacterium]